MRIATVIILACVLSFVMSLKDLICGPVPKLKLCTFRKLRTALIFYYYDVALNTCNPLKNPCQKLVRKFTTKDLCTTWCVE